MADAGSTGPGAAPLPASIPGRLARVVSRFADRVAVRTPQLEWTYAELGQRSDVVARLIVDRRGPGSEPVALLMDHGAPLIAALLGVLKAGKLFLVLEPADPAAHLTARLRDAQPGLLLTDPPHASLARSLAAEPLEVVEIDPRLANTPGAWVAPDVPPETGAWVMYTSGSTGVAKGVWQDHRGVVHHSDVYGHLIRLPPEDRLSLVTSCSLAASATPLFTALLHGATLCPFPLRSQGVERMAEWLHQERISVYHSVPTVFRHLVRSANRRRPLEVVRLVRLGGEPVLRSDIEACRKQGPPECVLMHALSSTETGLTPQVFACPVGPACWGTVACGDLVGVLSLPGCDRLAAAVAFPADWGNPPCRVHPGGWLRSHP